MIETIIIILIVLWLLGFHFGVGGGLIHILIVLAIIGVIYRIYTGRNPVP